MFAYRGMPKRKLATSKTCTKRIKRARNAETSELEEVRADSTQQLQHGCTLCEYRSSKKSHLATHMRTHTGDRPFHCEYTEDDGKLCGKSFITKGHL